MDVGAAFVADTEPPVLVKPANGAFDDPALPAETRAVRGAPPGDLRADPAGAQLLAPLLGLVGAVADHRLRPPPRPASLAAHGRDRVDQRQQFLHVGLVAAAQAEGERGAPSAGQRMVLGAAPGAVDGAWSRLLAPPTARTCELSTTARDQSIRSA